MAHVVGLRPALIDPAGSDFGAHIQHLRERSRPEALCLSPLADDEVTSVHGRDVGGKPLAMCRSTLRALLTPYLAHPEDYGEGGAYTYTPVMVNKDRPEVPEFAGFFPPAEAWHAYFLGSAPEIFPLDLLAEPAHMAAAHLPSSAPPRRTNTSIILGVGTGIGQPFHWHGANIFVQLHGVKKWSLFPNSELYAFFAPGQPYHRRRPCPFDARYAEAFTDIWWRGPADMPRPTEVVTRPGDVLYMPTGTWHATWNLSDYTFGLTKVVDV